MRKIGLRSRAWMSALAAILLTLTVTGWIYFFPLQYAEMSNRYEFWREGVTEINSVGLHAYVQDRCLPALHPGKSCTCVALIHGLADNAMTWKKLLLWPGNGWLEPVKLVAVDLPGSGGSPAPERPSEGYRVRNQARAVQNALAPLCKDWVVVGNSMGGWVASWVALDWSQSVTRLILLDSAGLKNATAPEVIHAFTEPTVESLKDFQSRAYFKGRPLPDNVWRAAAERMKASNARQIVEAQTPDDYLDGKISTLRKPVLILWGEADRITPLSEGMKLKSLLPGSVWLQVPQCGHLPQKECPLEVIKVITKMITFGSA